MKRKVIVWNMVTLDGYFVGKRLDLTLVEAAPLPTGVVFMRYQRTA